MPPKAPKRPARPTVPGRGESLPNAQETGWAGNGMVPQVLKVFESPTYLDDNPKLDDFIRRLAAGEFKERPSP